MKKYVKEKPSFWYVLVLVLFIILVYGGTLIFLTLCSDKLDGETKRNLDEIASQNVEILKAKIEKDVSLLDAVANFAAETNYDINGKEVKKLISDIEEKNPDVKIYVSDLFGIGYDKKGKQYNIVNKDFFLDINRLPLGSTAVHIEEQSNFLADKSSIIYVRCVTKLNHRNGVVMAVFEGEDYDEYIETKFYNGEGYSYIIKSTGEAVSAKYHPESAVEISKEFGFDDNQSFSSVPELKNLPDELAAGKDGMVEYNLNGEIKYMTYKPIGINDWYLLSVIPKSVANPVIISVTIASLGLSTVIVIAFVLFFMWYGFFRNKKNRQINKYAYEDILTGVHNWGYMVERATDLINNSSFQYAFVVFDINRFKLINDIYGYNYGDVLLKNVAKTMEKNIDEDEVLSRISGDIFTMLVKMTSQSELTERLEKIFKSICDSEQKKMEQNSTYKMTFSCGVCPIEDKGLSITAAMDRANMAKNVAKGYYLGNIAFYNEKIKRNMVEEQEIENSMNRAITNEEFEVYLQPQYKLNTETISGAEALIRWNHPEKGLLSPGRFIPIFENNGFIVKLDYYVFEHVCRKLREWLDQGKPPISIAVNMSRHHIVEEDFVKHLVEIANKYKILPSNLEIELTENIFFENQDAIVSVMSQLKEAGFKLSMDDFGSGYSSLNLLTEIPVDVIKIDREFFKTFETNVKSKKVVSMVIKLVRDLKMKVIAEGVETIEQVLFLKNNQCDIVQGYYFAKPMPLNKFEQIYFPSGEKTSSGKEKDNDSAEKPVAVN